MGNRGVITTEQQSIGVYLHWNGGRDSVEAFLEYCKIKGYRSPESDCYGWARLCQVIGNFFGGSTSIGIDSLDKLDCDNFDNGVYIIKDWEVIGRKYFGGFEQSEHNRTEMLISINEMQPIDEQLPKEWFTSLEKETKNISIGEMVYIQDFTGKIKVFEVIGLGKNETINGTNVHNMPYTNKYGVDNINSYLRENAYRVKQ